MSKPIDSMHTIRDKQIHDARRRIWDQGFNSKGVSRDPHLTSVKNH